ncbi:MAG: hypothetical protein WCW30_00045 [Candidatus Gracilibacteria bacterium]
MTSGQYISLKDASLLTDRSPQTIRRLIKSNQIRYRKYKTPQGFSYLVEKTSLLDHFRDEEVREEEFDQELVELGETEAELIEEFTPNPSFQSRASAKVTQTHIESESPLPPSPPPSPAFPTIINELIRQHREDKDRLFELLETFQKRILTLEDHIRQIEAPKQAKRKWYQIFKR